jgi:hypothetical protein
LEQAAALIPDGLIVQRDDGMWGLGWHDDAPGPFETRQHAAEMRKAALAGGPKVAKSTSSVTSSSQFAVDADKFAAAAERVRT